MCCYCQFTRQRSLPSSSKQTGRSSDTFETMLEDSSLSSRQAPSHPTDSGDISKCLFELSHSNCFLGPLITGASGRPRRRLHPYLDPHWPTFGNEPSKRGSLNGVGSTWRDPHFEFYLVSPIFRSPSVGNIPKRLSPNEAN